MTKREPLRVAGLFAGIGGLERGLARAGHKTALLCEVEPGARAVLKAKYDDVFVHEDVKTLASVSNVDLITAGFPCQDLSQAGATAGIDGAKSGLVSEVWRLLAASNVNWVLLENVPFMLRLGRGRALDVIVTALESLGYTWAYRIVNTMAFGLPQRRERVFLLAARRGDPREVLLPDEAIPPELAVGPSAYGFYWTEGNRGVGWAVDVTPPLKGGSGVGIPSPPAIYVPPGRFLCPDITDAERLQGFPVNWTLPAEKVTKAGHRWKLVGNAVSVPVAAWIGERLREPRTYDFSQDKPFESGAPWPKAAWGQGNGVRYASSASAWPRAIAAPPLTDFLKHEGRPLSHGAAAGFLSRARRAQELGKLRFEPGFLDALARHVASVAPRLPRRA